LRRANFWLKPRTAPGGAPFAGCLAMQSSFGVIYTTNNSPDPEHGIGRWSRRDGSRESRGWTAESLSALLAQGLSPLGAAFSDMHPVVIFSSRYLTPTALLAAITFLLGNTVPPVKITADRAPRMHGE